MKKIINNWFKHKNDATFGTSIQGMIAQKKYRAICLYWFILERLDAAQNGNSTTLSIRLIASTLGTDRRGVENDLRTCSEQVGATSFELVGDLVRISVSNYSEFKGVENRIEYNRIEENIYSGVNTTSRADPIPYQDIINDLNKVLNTKYLSTTKAVRKDIAARWKDGFRRDDFKQVVEFKKEQWINNEDMAKYLRPATLFSNKFEGYLNEVAPVKGSKNKVDDYGKKWLAEQEAKEKINKNETK